MCSMTVDARGQLWLADPIVVFALLSALWVVLAWVHSAPPSGRRGGDARQLRQRLRDGFGGVRVVLQRAAEIGVVGSQVEMAVTRQVEQHDALLASFIAAARL